MRSSTTRPKAGKKRTETICSATCATSKPFFGLRSKSRVFAAQPPAVYDTGCSNVCPDERFSLNLLCLSRSRATEAAAAAALAALAYD